METPFFNIVGPNGGEISLYLQDGIQGMRGKLESGSVDIVVFSPGRYEIMSKPSYLSWVQTVAKEVRRVLNDEGSLFLIIGKTPADPWVPIEVAQIFRPDFVLQNHIVWAKSIAIEKVFTGNCKKIIPGNPTDNESFLSAYHEHIFLFTKNGKVRIDRLSIGVSYKDKANIKRWKSVRAGGRCRGDVWFIPYETITQKPHPAGFPIRLVEMCIKVHGRDRTKLVLDPFIGMGSTALACLKLGVSCLGFDINPDNLKIASSRIASLIHPS